jgi:hypothetical protein
MATPQTLETVRRIQVALATGYSSMGAWQVFLPCLWVINPDDRPRCLLHPSSVIVLGPAPQYALTNRTTSLLMRCFGAQAMTAGLLLGTST